MFKNLSEELSLVEKLVDSENYQLWKFKVKVLLEARELYGLVTEETEEASKTAEWRKKDANAKKVIVTTLDQKPLMHILNSETSFQMWSKLKAVYERDTEQQKCSLMQEFFGYQYDKNGDIAANVSKLQNFAHRLRVLETEIDDKMLISKILVTLPEQYKYFSSAWESTNAENRTLENLISRLLLEESRNNLEKEKPVAFKAQERRCRNCNKAGHQTKDCRAKGNLKGKKCFTCNKTGHFSSNCPNKTDNNNGAACSICKKTNHSEKECFFCKKEYKGNGGDKVSFMTAICHDSRKWIPELLHTW